MYTPSLLLFWRISLTFMMHPFPLLIPFLSNFWLFPSMYYVGYEIWWIDENQRCSVVDVLWTIGCYTILMDAIHEIIDWQLSMEVVELSRILSTLTLDMHASSASGLWEINLEILHKFVIWTNLTPLSLVESGMGDCSEYITANRAMYIVEFLCINSDEKVNSTLCLNLKLISCTVGLIPGFVLSEPTMKLL